MTVVASADDSPASRRPLYAWSVVTIGMPASVAFEICAFTSAGTAGLSWIRELNPFRRPSSSTEPISAVPSDAPRFCAVPCSPPASFVSSGGAEDMITLPSCDISSPAPIPKNTSDTANAVPFSFTSIVPTSTSAAIAIAPRPTWTTVRGPRFAATFGPASAAASIEIDIGNSRLPVSNASKPSTTWRYTGSTKNVPITISCCAASELSPPRSGSILSRARFSSVLLPSRSRRSSHAKKQPSTTRPPMIRNGTTENPSGLIACPLIVGTATGLIQPQVLLFRIPNTIRPNATAESAAPP